MNLNYFIIGGIVLLIIINIYFFLKNSKPSDTTLKQSLNELIPSIIELSSKQAKEQLASEKQDIKTDLSNKKEAIESLVKRVVEEIEKNNRKIEMAEQERIGSFRALKAEVENQRVLTEQLNVTAEGLKKVLSNNQLRGQFGEQVAEDLLRMSGFVKGVDYHSQKEQAGSETRPDFTILLPDGTKINVDSKFPYANLQKMIETDDKQAKVELLKAFERDIKQKMKQITTRDYINPEDKTVDFVILFVPNEMIFSFIYDKMNEIWLEGMKNKVILAGPFSFTAILRMVKQAYESFKYQENAQKIITYIKTFEKEFEKYNQEFEKLGGKIDQLSKQYEEINGVRTRQLIRTVDKIRLEEGEQSEELQASLPEM